MDPLSAFGLASNIIQFVEFTSKLVSGTYEIYSSKTGMTDEHADLAKVTEDLHAVTRSLSYKAGPAITDDEIALLDLVKNCRELSEDLLRLLKKLQPKNPKSKSESFRVAWRVMRKRGTLESLEKRINRYRKQILDRIVIMMSEDTSSICKLLQNSMKTNATSAFQTRKELQELRETVLSLIEKLRRNEAERKLDSENMKRLLQTPEPSGTSLVEVHTMLSRVTQITATISREDWILNKLSFTEIHNRELSIEAACAETFQWLLYDSLDETLDKNAEDEKASKGNQEEEVTGQQNGRDDLPKPELSPSESGLEHGSDLAVSSEGPEASQPTQDDQNQLEIKQQESEERKETRLKFLSWLNSGSGVFHMLGKLGSGKSTLMKFLSEEARTKQELQKWAEGKRLVFSPFFFWASGEPIQRSLEGLYRGILWETLRECPSLMRDVFPRYWDADFNPANDRLQDGPFSISELVAAFELLIQSKTIFDNHKICFFIDGLDEFDGDHWKLARRLKKWSDTGDLKICVSSRPYNEFIHTFTDPNKHLRLHDLTRQDIRKFAEDEFERDERYFSMCAQDESYARLVQSLITKADGVFLWVRLATRELLSGMGNSFSISQLEEELDQLPGGLEALFRKILTSIRKPDRMRAARAFLVMTSDIMFRGINTLAIVHAVIDELSDANYDAAPLYSAELYPSALTRDDFERMTNTMQDRLNSRCKGLIQISKQSLFEGEKLPRLEFIHRSIYEFLAMRDVKAELLQNAGPNFDSAKFMCMAFLRLLKSSYRLAEGNQDAEQKQDSPQLNKWHKEVTFGSYFWVLEQLAMPVTVIASQTESEGSCPCLKELEAASELVLKLSACLPATPAPKSSVMVLEVGYQLMQFKFLSDSNAVRAQEWTWLALCTLVGTTQYILDRTSRLPALLGPSAKVNLLLLASVVVWHERNVDVQQALVASLLGRGISPNWTLSDSSRFVPVIPSFPHAMDQRQTTWTTFLRLVATLVQSTQNMRDDHQIAFVCKSIERYLEFGADPTVVFVGHQIVIPEEGQDGKDPDESSEGSDESSEILVGPAYLDLGQLVEVWNPPNKQDILDLWNRKRQPAHTLWELGLNFTRGLWQSKPVHQIPRIETESLRSSMFLTAAVVSANELPKVDVSDSERWARTAEGRQWLLGTKGAFHREIWSGEI